MKREITRKNTNPILSFLRGMIRRSDSAIRLLRKHWVIPLLVFLLPLLVSVAQFIYKDRKDEREKRMRQYGFSIVMRAESHGRGTIAVTCSDPKETPPDIDLAIDWQITNLGNTQNSVVAYFIIVKSGNRDVKLRQIGIQSPHYLVQQHDGISQYTDVSNRAFDNIAYSRVLSPGDSIGGWAFFKVENPNDRGFVIERLSIYIFDAYGTLTRIVPKRITEGDYNQFTEGRAKTNSMKTKTLSSERAKQYAFPQTLKWSRSNKAKIPRRSKGGWAIAKLQRATR